MARNAPPASNNALTPSFASVSSAAGFSSGDLVYSKDSDFGLVAGNTVSTALFPISSTTATSAFPNQNGAIKQATPSGGGVYWHGRIADKLTNGNIVIVSATPSEAYIFFRIIDENNNEIVAKTYPGGVGSYQARYGTVDVCALTGGGFAVIWYDLNYGSPFYAIYSNTGSVVLAPYTDAENQSGPICSAAMPNGNFIIAWNYKSGSQSYFKIIGPTGTTVLAAVALGNPLNTNVPIIPVVRSDNTFFIIFAIPTANNLTARRYNSSGVFQTAYAIATTYGGASYGYSACVVSNNGSGFNDYIYIAFNNSSNQFRYSTITPANAVTGDISPAAGINTFAPYIFCNSGGNLVIPYADSTWGALRMTVRNPTGFAVVGASNSLNFGHPLGSLPSQFALSLVETTNYYSYFTSNIGSITTATSYAPVATIYSQMAKTTPYAVRNTNTISVGVSSVSANVSGYARGGSTPNGAAFLASTTQTLSVTPAQSSGPTSWFLNGSVLDAASNALAMTMMQNGQFVVAYSLKTTGQTKFGVYSSAGVLLNTYTVAATSANTTADDGCLRCCTLPNGKLVIAYPDTSTTVRFAIYSSSYVLITNVAWSPGISLQATNACTNYGFSMSALGYPSNRFVIGAIQSGSGQVLWNVLDDTGTSIGGGLNYSSSYSVQVHGLPNGSFIYTWVNQPAATPYLSVGCATLNYDGISWTDQGGFQTTLGASYAQYCTLGIASPSGVVALVYRDNLPSLDYVARVNGQSSVTTSWSQNFSIVDSTSNCGSVALLADGSFYGYMYNYGGNYGTNNFTATATSPAGSLTSSTSLPNAGQPTSLATGPNGPNVKIIGLYDNVCAFAYLDSSARPNVGLMVINTGYTYSSNIIAGVTPSNVAFNPSPANGYYLAGVAASNCTAGGTGVIQTNGAATLNSQYPATTTSQAFDFTSLTVSGVRGTIAGRNLVIRGS